MNEVQEYQTAFSRAIYSQMRKDAGCPPIIAVRLTPAHWGWYVEVKDGSFSIDSIPTSECSDVWEAKCKCIKGWQLAHLDSINEARK